MNIEEKIIDLENQRFLLSMKDHWTREDFDKDNELMKEISLLKNKK